MLVKVLHINDVDYIIHGASIASPSIYRIYHRNARCKCCWNEKCFETGYIKKVTNVVIMSSSEVYGDPDNNNITYQ